MKSNGDFNLKKSDVIEFCLNFNTKIFSVSCNSKNIYLKADLI